MNTPILLLCALLLAACASTETATLIVPSGEPGGFTLISVNPSLGRSAEPTELARGFAEDGATPKFRLLLQNGTAWAQRLNYRVEWLDEQDMTLRGQVDIARPLTIPGGSVGVIESVAPSAKAKRFRLWLTETGGAAAVR